MGFKNQNFIQQIKLFAYETESAKTFDEAIMELGFDPSVWIDGMGLIKRLATEFWIGDSLEKFHNPEDLPDWIEKDPTEWNLCPLCKNPRSTKFYHTNDLPDAMPFCVHKVNEYVYFDVVYDDLELIKKGKQDYGTCFSCGRVLKPITIEDDPISNKIVAMCPHCETAYVEDKENPEELIELF